MLNFKEKLLAFGIVFSMVFCLAYAAKADWKFNPFTQKLDYYEPDTPGSFTGTLNDISDVATTSTSYGDLLMWGGSAWTNSATSTLGIAGGSGTVTSVGLTASSSFSIYGTPITSSGTFGLGLASGYTIPLSASTTEWATAYGWGDHSGLYDILGQATSTLASHTGTYNHDNFLLNGGTQVLANICGWDGTGIDCAIPLDSSGACAGGSICSGGHTHILTLTGNSGSDQTLTTSGSSGGDSLNVRGGTGLTAVAGATDTITISPATGYVIPLTASTTEWDTAYGWGNHASAGYATSTYALIVCASDAQSSSLCDYTCDGTADDVQIQAAIDALPSDGGTVILSDGEFNVATTVAWTDHSITLRGQGVDATTITAVSDFDVIKVGSKQDGGEMINFTKIESLTVSLAGGASTKACIKIDGGGRGTVVRDVQTNEGAYGLQLIDLDRCYFENIDVNNVRDTGILLQVGEENTFGTVQFTNASVALSDATSTGMRFSNTAGQESPNRFDRIGIYNSLFFNTSGVASTTGLKMEVGATAMVVQNSLFENNEVQVHLVDDTQITFIADSFMYPLVSADIFKFENDNHFVTIQDCRLQQGTRGFNGVSGYTRLTFLGNSTNQGNITSLFSGSFGGRFGTDVVFAGDDVLVSGGDNERYNKIQSTYHYFKETSSAPDTADGKGALFYRESDGALVFKDEGGDETALGAGSMTALASTNMYVGNASNEAEATSSVTMSGSIMTLTNRNLKLTGGANPTFTIKSDDNNNSYFRYGEVDDFRGGFFNYDGSINTMSIGVHDASDSNPANDTKVINIPRATGYVGIGTTTPAYKLDVYGNTRIDGTLTTVGNITAPAFIGNVTGTASGNLISGGTLTSAYHCRWDGTGIDCDRVEDASGACGSNAVCMGGHTHVGVNETYGAGWDADTGTPEKDDVYDYMHLMDTDDDGLANSLDTDAVDNIAEIAAALKDGSGDCSSGLICLGDHTHSQYLTESGGGWTFATTTLDYWFNNTTGTLSRSELAVTTTLTIPNGTGPTANDPGELAHDTTNNQLILDDYVVGMAKQTIWSTTIASTSPAFLSGGLLPVPLRAYGYTITDIDCYVVGGTSKVIAVEDAGTNSSEDITCTTSLTSDDGSITNATYTAGELANIDFGASSGAVDYVTITVTGTITRE